MSTLVPVSSEKGYALLRRNLLRFEQRRPVTIDWETLPTLASGGFNEVKTLPPSLCQSLGVPTCRSLVVRRSIKPTKIRTLIDEAWLTKRMSILQVTPIIHSMWLEREYGETARLYIIMQGFDATLRTILKERNLSPAEGGVLQAYLSKVAESGYLLLDIKPSNVVCQEAENGLQFALIDFSPGHTVKVPDLTSESRELIHTSLLVAFSICFTGRVLLETRLEQLSNDPAVRFLNDSGPHLGGVWDRVQSQVNHYLKARGCIREGQSVWSYLISAGAVARPSSQWSKG